VVELLELSIMIGYRERIPFALYFLFYGIIEKNYFYGGKTMQSSKLYVGNLSYSVTVEELKTLFAAHGEVKDTKVIEGKGFGFVEMSTPEEAETAKNALNNTEFKGRNLKVDEARPQKAGGGSDRPPRRNRNFQYE
jgi:RNA recognition motif-containing protein